VPSAIPEEARGWFDRPEHATLATVMPDGRPQLSVVWAGLDGDDVVISTVKGRQKYLNIARDPRVSVVVFPSEDPDRYIEVRGTATMTEDGAVALVDRLAGVYLHADRHAADDGTDHVRVVIRITPERVVFRG
jgi:PPOX class probable F420-dependent enzyme